MLTEKLSSSTEDLFTSKLLGGVRSLLMGYFSICYSHLCMYASGCPWEFKLNGVYNKTYIKHFQVLIIFFL